MYILTPSVFSRTTETSIKCHDGGYTFSVSKSQTNSDMNIHDDRTPMQQRVFELVKSMISDGRIRPGEKLLEAHVARAFGVSRSPARHALEALRASKLVRLGEGRGYLVSGHCSAADRGVIAKLDDVAVEPVARWERIYTDVEQQICKSVLHHSVRVTEERLAEHFGVSRTVARDALARLHSAGVVSKDKQGRWVADRVTLQRIRDLYEVRCLLEPVALVHSVRAISHEYIRRARDSLKEALRNSISVDSKAHAALEHELHIVLLSACPNKELLRALERTHLLLISNHYMFDMYLGFPRAHLDRSLQEHLQVIGLLLNQRWDEAATSLRRHLQDSCEVWVERFESASSRPCPPMPTYLTVIESPPPWTSSNFAATNNRLR